MQNWYFFSNEFSLKIDKNNLENITRKLKKPIVFTNGVFDILHTGHIDYLRNSKKLGASLIVGINSNKSTQKLSKGLDRPIIDEKDRAEIISSLKPVDLCVIFSELTPENLIKQINPDIYTKGNEYNISNISYSKTLNSLKIKTYFIPIIKNKSSTLIINKIRDNILV